MKFADATRITQIDSSTYTTDFHPEWVIGNVPHGGYVTSCIQQVVRKHYATTLKGQNQPHTLALHLDFLRRTQTGPATFRVKNVKLGRQTSVVHVTLSQDGREEVVGYITNTNLNTEAGVSFPTGWDIHPKPPAAVVSNLESDTDPLWGERKEWPFVEFRKATNHIRSWFPRDGQPLPTIVDMWMCLREPGDRWTNESLGFVADTFPQIIESFAHGVDSYSVAFEKEHGREGARERMGNKAGFWYPTVLLNLDVKKALPDEGVRFLYMRLQAKVIKNGRYDLEVILRDETGDVVALSHHIVFVVGVERNRATRAKLEEAASKL
ncbi:hypothetical protein BAUCODRAFT_39279 [Baudoinia panamericana UAMH 10762]|uniref:Thioesterase domain-containing protein n=1 Tax=Baudoinia panamericana (strain UAMH 10762) TaxID=717646 RepID=M2MIP1_BAUPA|nr:uncharacterized protein BAUCODRAFT_39279 [Baudoinia panamericana UAMH 10762]EMC91138.1 hypothetical protein BAUCODRAFT_39279 [Baudoinia panamericana UAMH 10762]